MFVKKIGGDLWWQEEGEQHLRQEEKLQVDQLKEVQKENLQEKAEDNVLYYLFFYF